MVFDIISYWLKNKKRKSLLLYGDTKSFSISSKIKNNYNIYKLFPNNFINTKKTQVIFEDILKTRDILNINKNKIIFVYEINEISKKVLGKIIQKLNDNILLVMIGVGNCDKHIKELSKMSDIKKITSKRNKQKPCEDVFSDLDEESDVEKINLVKEKNILMNNFLKEIQQNNDVDKTDLDEIATIFSKNLNEATELYDLCSDICSKPKTMEETYNIFNIEKIFIPLTIHYNYHNFISNKTNNKTQQYEDFEHISNIISKGENIHYHIYDKHIWDLNKFYSIYSTYYPSQYLNNPDNEKVPLRFTNIISKNSSKFIRHYSYYNLLKKNPTTIFDKKIIEVEFKLILKNILSLDESSIIYGMKQMKKHNLSIQDIPAMIKVSRDLFFQEKYKTMKKQQLRKMWKNFNLENDNNIIS